MERSCDTCEYYELEGGGRVPYGSTWATTPENEICNCFGEEVDI